MTTSNSSDVLRLVPLGGVGRFGRNCLLLEDRASGRCLIVDCGVRFVGDEAPGFDVGLPDLERLASLAPRIDAIAITHGHEDHIGGLPYALRDLDCPVWATPFTTRLIERRLRRHGVDKDITVVRAGDQKEAGPFRVRFVNVSHSIPDATCLVIDTPAGTVVHSGDFRVDDDPVLGDKTDLETLTAAGDRGVALLLADSTGAHLPGDNRGERSVEAAMQAAFVGCDGALFVAQFASHIQRLALLAEVCRANRRKLCLVGRGLLDAKAAATELGILHIDDVLVDEQGAHSYPRDRLCYALTGTQGEPRAALARLAQDDAHLPDARPGDRVIVSARMIPGNELKVTAVLDALAERGVDIVDGARAPHVSGHGNSGDLEKLLLATRPRAFAALHGNARHLLAHAALARRTGLDAAHVVDLRDGHALDLHPDGRLVHHDGARAHEPFGRDGLLAVHAKEALNERRRMHDAGVLVLVIDAGGVTLEGRGIAPDLDDDLQDAIAHAAKSEIDEASVMRAVQRLFKRFHRPCPELVVVQA